MSAPTDTSNTAGQPVPDLDLSAGSFSGCSISPSMCRTKGQCADTAVASGNRHCSELTRRWTCIGCGGSFRKINVHGRWRSEPDRTLLRSATKHRTALWESRTYTESLVALETCGKPVAVAINGTALGGALELALACHHRIVADDEKIRLGLPEASLGLIPGGGGTQRLPRIIGIEQAAKLILKSKLLTPGQALELGMVDAVMPPGEILQGAEWVLDQSQSSQPWDRKGFRVPGGSGLNDMRIGRLFQQLTASVER